MLQSLTALAALAGFAAAACGWGRAVTWRCGATRGGGQALAVALGLSVMSVLGGVLNALGWAFSGALWAVLAVGWLFLPAWWVAGRARGEGVSASLRAVPDLPYRVATVLAVAGVAFLVATQVPAGVFNHDDDFRTYFVRPVRMLQTGTLGGNPFDVLGLDSLGGASFLQGFTLLCLPLADLGVLDSVFGFALSAALLLGLARRLEVGGTAAAAGLAVLVLMPPQQVNISAVYLAAAFILALIHAALDWVEGPEGARPAPELRRAVPVGLLAAGLVVLKNTLVPFAVLFLAGLLGLWWLARRSRRVVAAGAAALGVAVLAVLPWLAPHGGHLWMAVAGGTGTSVQVGGDLRRLWSVHRLFWGGNQLGFNLAVAGLAAAAATGAWTAFRSRDPGVRLRLLPLIAAWGAAALAYLVDGAAFDPDSAVRYACPVLLGTVPLGVLAAGVWVPRARPGTGPRVALVLALAIAVMFGSALARRVGTAWSLRTTVSYPASEDDARFTAWALGPKARERVRELQERTVPSATVLAWIAVPFDLDFRRNSVMTVTEPGLVNPWLDLPVGRGPAGLDRFLADRHVRYVIWDYRGYRMKSAAELLRNLRMPYPLYQQTARRTLYLRVGLAELSTRSRILFDDGATIVFEVPSTPGRS